MKAKLSVLAILSTFAAAAAAEPAPWHLWESRLDGKTHCAQTSPGAGWEKNDGSFSNARCRRLQNRPSGIFVREFQSEAERKNRALGLMAIFVSARATR